MCVSLIHLNFAKYCKMCKLVIAVVLASVSFSVTVMAMASYDWKAPRKHYTKSKAVKVYYDADDNIVDDESTYDHDVLNDMFSDLLAQPRTKAPTHIVIVQPPAIDQPSFSRKGEKVDDRRDRDDDDRRNRSDKDDRSDKYERPHSYKNEIHDRHDIDWDNNRRYGSSSCGGGDCCGGGGCTPTPSQQPFDPTSLLALLLSILLPLLFLVYYLSTNTNNTGGGGGGTGRSLKLMGALADLEKYFETEG